MNYLIKNAHIVSPDIELKGGSILIKNHSISQVIPPGHKLPVVHDVYDAGGNYVFPGFVDIHAHGADRKDVCDNQLESIRHIAKRKLEEGVTTWLPTTLTQPQELLLEIADKCAQYKEQQEFAKTPGLHVEGPFINVKKAGAQNPKFVRPADFKQLKALHDICPTIVFSIAPCIENACSVIRSAKEIGISSSAAHTEATYAEVCAAKRAGLTHLTHFGNAMTGLHHREIGVVGAGLIDDDLKIELICDGIHLSPDFIKTVLKLKPIDQIILITDSMAGSWIQNGECSLGGLPVAVNNGVARLKEGGSLAGSTLLFNQGVKNLVDFTGLPLDQIVKATSWNQAQSLGLENIGKIEQGFLADLVILDPDFQVIQSFVEGRARL